MTLLRAGARSLLASYFVVSGVKAVRNPNALVPAAQPLADRFVPLVKQYAPAQIAARIPEDTAALVRLNGATQLLGGLALATGKGRRLGAVLLAATLVPSTLAKHPFWTRTDPEEKAADKAHFLKNTSLLGGVLLAARDTEGKPGIAWRAQKTGHRIAKTTGRTSNKLTHTTHALADSALAEGAVLVGAVAASTRKARKAAAKQAAEARKVAEKRAQQAAKDARKLAKRAKKEAPKQLAAARKEASKQAAAARRQASRTVADMKKTARDVASNISLGEN
jgi:uncharacterized membrane protein YphA (DoxX/SURF4 family)